MMKGSMTHAEMMEFCQHMKQLALHAGNALCDAQRAAPAWHYRNIDRMMEATRVFWHATAFFEAQTAALRPEALKPEEEGET